MKNKAAVFLFVLGAVFSASITGVRVQPDHSFYNTGKKAIQV